MPKEKNILVNRGIPMNPQIIGINYVVGSTNSTSGSASAIDYIGRKVVSQFEADWGDMSDFDLKRMMKDLNVHHLRGKIIPALAQAQNNVDSLYADSSALTDIIVKQELSKSGYSHSDVRANIANNKKIVDGLVSVSEQNLAAFIATSHIYSGSDPLTLTQSQRTQIAMKGMGSVVGLYPQRAREQLDGYATSYVAAKDAVMLRQAINQLVSLSAALSLQLAVADAAAVEAAKELVRLGKFPGAPPGVSLDNNMQEALENDQFYPSRGSAHFYSWFYMKVRNGGPWDYKNGQPQYESFGNFHYGAVGTAAEIPEAVLLRAAGAAQMKAGTSEEKFGYFWGDAPYGDDPVDQVWIKAGIDYAKSKGY